MRLYSIMIDFMNAKNYISLACFVAKYKVSKRTIQNDLSYLTQMSSRKGYQLHMRRGWGYLLEMTNQCLLHEFILSLENNIDQNTNDRTKNIAGFLCLQQNFISMEIIADAFHISKTSVKNEMEAVAAFVKTYELQLDRKSHYGIRVVGTPRFHKELLVDLYFDENVFIKNKVQGFVNAFLNVDTALVTQFEKENVSINYHELRNIIVWLEVSAFYAYIANEKDDGISLDSVKINTIEHITWNIKRLMENYCNIHLGKESVELIVTVLQKNIRSQKTSISLGKELKQHVDIFLKEIDALYDTTFEKDTVFKRSLLIHVTLLIDRLHQKISYKNTLINEICIHYPMLFNIAIRFSAMLKENYDVQVTGDEASFIATHFLAHMEKERTARLGKFNKIGVVCSTGGGSAYLIKIQISSLFTRAEVGTFSFLEMSELEQFKPDVIFTIMPLHHEFHVPVILIRELLDDADLIRIRQVLQYDNGTFQSIEALNSYVYTIFHKPFFHICKKANNYLEILQKMAEQIEKSGFGGEHYARYVMEREAYMNTIYLHGVCIAHPIELCAKKNLISVCILENPILYKTKEVKIIFMVALTKDEYEMHKNITIKLYQLMKDEKRLERALQARTFEEFLIVIKEIKEGTI